MEIYKFTTEELFWQKVDKKSDDECWEWLASKNNKGYGQFRNNKNTMAHRYSWELHNGEIPKIDDYPYTMSVCHSCDNPGCVNPNHLFLGTAKDNAIDRDLKGRHRCGKGINHGKVTVPDWAIDFAIETKKYTDYTYQQCADLLNQMGFKTTKGTVWNWCNGKFRINGVV